MWALQIHKNLYLAQRQDFIWHYNKLSEMKRSIIAGVGHFVPEKVVTNADLAKIMDTSDEWIVERTGIRERRYFDPEKDTCSNMGVRAPKRKIP